jgi:hypothetical protein
MTRWITVHATQGVTLDRNVGYLSIGHGFYLEDAVETDNKFYSNLGIFARAAVENDQNPRRVPGILASPDVIVGRPPPNPLERVRYESDRETPAVFWITNGWNDFQGNMAAGAGMCGVCFWQLPASISGPSRSEKWESYAAEQRCPLTPVQPKEPPFFTPPFAQVCDRTGTSPIMNFDGNFCTSAMTSFSDVGFLQACPGVVQPLNADPNSVPWVNNPKAPRSLALKPECGPGTKWPICSDDYYPNIDDGQVKQATQCPTGQCDDPNATVIFCQESNETNCLPTVINDYTSSFHWAQYNFSAIWLRARWHLVSNSFISDVQNAGLSFISGGDYTHSSAIKGLWELALKTVFVGSTQAGVNGLTDQAHAFASVLTPFSPASAGLTCDNNNIGLYCLSKNNSVTLGGFSGFSVSQHMFNIYDGPAHEDSNAYLNIKRIPLNPVSNSVYKAVLGIPKAVRADPPGHPEVPTGQCYMQNAAIAWKQSNGFYYPPTFHSGNLFFNNVDIRHYVIVPQFIPNTYTTNAPEAADRYCTQNNGLFTGFSAIDRQTELTDDDGSLTGYKKTISVNEDPFFKAPITGIECDSDGAVKEGGTATTSPYDYVTTVVYPDCNKQGGGGGPECANFYPKNPPPTPGEWDADCGNQTCFGVPLYREYQTGSEVTGNKIPEFIRMAGSAIYQRETMTVDHGRYYVDVTASDTTQTGTPVISPPCPTCQPSLPWQHKNVFVKNETYDFFLVYATLKTEQTYQMYVGTGRTMADVVNSVKPIRVNTANAPFAIHQGTSATDKSAIQVTGYDSTKGVVTVNINLQGYTNEFTDAAAKLCVPQTFCKLSGTTCVAKDAGIIHGTTQAERDITCGYANKDIDCPTDLTDPTGKTIGCVGFSVTLPGNFEAKNQTGVPGSPDFLPTKLATCFPKDFNWGVITQPADPDRVGTCTTAHAPLTADFCDAAASSRLLGR